MFQFISHLFHHEQTSQKEKLISALLAFGYAIGMGTRGRGAMNSEWFLSLVRPEAQPPDWVFPIVWGSLFLLIGFAGYCAWNFYESNFGRKIFAALYALNGLLMTAWTDQFFINHNIGKGLLILVALIVVIEAMIIAGFYTNRKASYLLLPYLLWIFFATYLNAGYLTLN